MRSGGGTGKSQIGKRKREEGKMSAEMSCLCAAQGEVSCGLRTLVNLSLLSSDLWHRHNGTEHVCVCARASACVCVMVASLIGILVTGRGKAESPWRPGTKEERRRKERTRQAE